MSTPIVSGAKIVGIGMDDLGPDTIVTNDQLAAALRARQKTDAQIMGIEGFSPGEGERYETDDPWIVSHMQVRTRRIAPPGIATSDLAIQACRNALAHAKVLPEEVGSLRLATVTPDEWASPPTVSRVAHGLGIPVWDVEGEQLHELIACDHMYACSSFGAALQDGVSDLMLRRCDYSLVVGADKMSAITDWSDRAFCPIMGDGGGALLLKRVPYEESDFRTNDFYAGGDGSKASRIIAPFGGSRIPLTLDGIMADKLLRSTKLRMEGPVVFKELVSLLRKHIIPEALEKCGYTPSSIDLIAPHQANGKMTDAFEGPLRALGFTGVISRTIEQYGNTTGATVPLGILDAYRSKILQPGRIVMIIHMGGGYGWRVIFLRWSLS